MIDRYTFYLLILYVYGSESKQEREEREEDGEYSCHGTHTGVGGVKHNFPVLDFRLLISAAALHTPDGLAHELLASPSMSPLRAVGHWGYILASLHLASHLGTRLATANAFTCAIFPPILFRF